MPTTLSEILSFAADELGFKSPQEGLIESDRAKLEWYYRSVYADLDRQGLAQWAYNDNVPDSVATQVVLLVANKASISFGASQEKIALVNSAIPSAWETIRANLTPKYVSMEDATAY